jgi:tetratricopeptide (TPR) repeat protein
MSKFSKQVIAIVAIVLLVVVLYIGTYLPYRKGVSYITALGQAPQATSLSEFGHVFAVSLDLPSPVGQEELVRSFVNTMSSVIASNAKDVPGLGDSALQLVDHYAQPLLDRGRGLSFAQLLYVSGAAYETAYSATGNTAYSDKARMYYERGLELSPDRPQFLYPLLEDYRARGDKDKARELAERILSIWPDDAQTRALLDKGL